MDPVEIKQRSKQQTRRRERAHQLQYDKQTPEGTADERPDSPTIVGKGKARAMTRRDSSSGSDGEDIIDGFAIISFRTLEELEDAVRGASLNNNKANLPEESKTEATNSRSSTPCKVKMKKVRQPRKGKKQLTPSIVPSPKLELEVPQVNGSSECRPSTDQLSDISIHSSSGRGYLSDCESEREDERASASDAGSDLFTAVGRIHNNSVSGLPGPVPSCSLQPPRCVNGVSPAPLTTGTAATTTVTTSSVSATVTVTTTAVVTTPVPVVIVNGTRSPSRPLAPPQRATPKSRSPALPTTKSSSHSSSHHHHHRPHHSPIVREPHKFTPPPARTIRREECRDKEIFPYPKVPAWSGTSPVNNHYPSPHISPSPIHLNPFHSPQHPLPQSPLHPHPAAPSSQPPHGMFAPPLPTAVSITPQPGPTNTHNPFSVDPMSYANQDLLQQELNNRFLASHERVPPYLHQHQHQHMHQHQHTHQHTYGPLQPAAAASYSGSLVPTPTPHLYDKIPKFDSPFYPRHGMSTIPGYPVMQPSGATPLSSSLHGAFQPKMVSSNVHPAQMLLSRDREKAAAQSTSATKKSGKWCAVHVRVAWEIYHHQQKQQADSHKGSEVKAGEPLRPPSHLLPSSSLHRAPDLASQVGPPSFFVGARSPYESAGPPGGFFSPLGMSPFPRPSPYSTLAPSLTFGLAPGMFPGGREMPSVPGLTSPHEFNRLHRTPSSFPTPPAWTKPDTEREKEREREKEKERERERARERDREQQQREQDRERERQQEREREHSLQEERRKEEERERRNSVLHERHARDLELDKKHDHYRDRERLNSHSRSRSRSPIRNGRLEPGKLDTLYDKRYDDKVKVKEERREEDVVFLDREKYARNDFLIGNLAQSSMSGLSMLNDRRGMMRPPYLPTDRAAHPVLWSPYDKSMELNRHAYEVQREMEREREKMLNRFPLGSMLDHERYREDLMFRERERVLEGREYFDRMPSMYDRERMDHFDQKIPPLRPVDGLTSSLFSSRTLSPAINHTHSKSSSPACVPGAPPPLIPSGVTSTHAHKHSSAALCKPKSSSNGGGGGLSEGDKDKRDSSSNNSTDPDAHSR